MIRKLIYGTVLVVLLGVAGSASADLVAHWQFNEGTGSTAADSTTNGNDGTLYNMEEEDWGQLSSPAINTVAFDGTGDASTGESVIVEDDASLRMGAGPFSIAFWIKPISGGQVLIFGSSTAGYTYPDSTSSSGKRYDIGLSSGQISFAIDDNVTKNLASTSSTTVPGGLYNTGWHHVVCLRNTTTSRLEIYVDGVYRNGTNASAGNIDPNPGEKLRMGQHPLDGNASHFTGRLGDVRIYNHALTEEEIKAFVPMVAWDPTPADGQQNIGLTSDLSWRIPSDANEAWVYKVYLDTDSDLSDATPFVVIPGTGNTVTLTNAEIGGLAASDYWWRVDSDPNDGSDIRTGDLWDFNAGVGLPVLVSPPDNITLGYGLDINEPNMVWTSDTNTLRDHSRVIITPLGGTPTDCGIQEPPFILWDEGFQSILNWDTTYTWQVIEEDAGNNPVAVGPEWKFRIRPLVCVGIFADIDGSGDCVVNLADLAVMAGEWLTCGWEEGVPGRPCP